MRESFLQSRSPLMLAALVGSSLISATASAQTAPFDAVHIERTRSIRLDGTPDQVFPLFEPEGRRLWARHFAPQYLYPQSGEARAGMVFQTVHHEHEPSIWVLADYDPEDYRMRYVIFIPRTEAWELEIVCEPGPEGQTDATVVYRVTSLSEKANDMVQKFFDDDFEGAIDSWGSAINTYLRRG